MQWDIFIFKIQILMEKHAPQNGLFFIRFLMFTSNLFFNWLILLPPGVGWGIMGYESEPITSYYGLRKFSYSIMLNYVESPYTTQFHWQRPGLIISPSSSSPESAPPQRIVHRLVIRPHFLLWLHVALWCTLLWDEVLRHPLSPPRGVIPTPARPTCFRHPCDQPYLPVL